MFAGLAQRVLELVAGLRLQVHGVGEIAAVVAPFLLGLVQGDVGVAQQRADVVHVGRAGGDADADRDRGLAAGQVERLPQGRADLVGDLAGLWQLGRQQQREFIVAQAADGGRRRRQLAQPPGELAQQGVAGGVALGVVDGGETVQVDQQQGAGARPGRRQLRHHGLREQLAVRQAGQVVVAGHAQPVVAAAGVEQPHLQHIADAREQLVVVVGLAQEVLGAGLERAQLVVRLGGHHQHRQVLLGLDLAQAVEHFEAVHAGHVQVQHDQVVVVQAVHGGHRRRVAGTADVGVAGAGQHMFEQGQIDRLVVDQQDLGGVQCGGRVHGRGAPVRDAGAGPQARLMVSSNN